MKMTKRMESGINNLFSAIQFAYPRYADKEIFTKTCFEKKQQYPMKSDDCLIDSQDLGRRVIGGNRAYVKESLTMNSNLYRRFVIENGVF